MVISVLSLQGSFNKHIAELRRLGVKGMEMRKPEQLQNVVALIIPGGESTTMVKLAEYHNMLQSFEIELSVPEIASKEGGSNTFRGVFIRAPTILEVGPKVEVLADYSVPSKNSRDSKSNYETQEEKTVSEESVIVAVKQGNLLGTAFHPELTADTRWHSYFLKMVGEVAEQSSTSIVKEECSSDNLQQRSDLPIFQ